MPEVFALFTTRSDTQRAVRLLTDIRIPSEKVTVCSTETPAESDFLTPEERETRLPISALLGGILGLTAGYLLTALTARSMNLPTGGHPIVSFWAFGIVIFEFTALGAVVGTVLALLWEMGLFPFKKRRYDDKCAADLVRCGWLIGVDSVTPKELNKIQRAMQKAGAKKIITNW